MAIVRPANALVSGGHRAADPAEVADADPVEARRTLRDAHAPVEVLPVPALDAATDRRRRREISKLEPKESWRSWRRRSWRRDA